MKVSQRPTQTKSRAEDPKIGVGQCYTRWMPQLIQFSFLALMAWQANFHFDDRGQRRTQVAGEIKLKQIKFPDQRTKSWFLSNSPGPLFTILGTYLYFCLYAGPRYMKNRKPFQLKNTLIVYNVLQVAFSIVLVIEVSFPSPHWPPLNVQHQKSPAWSKYQQNEEFI